VDRFAEREVLIGEPQATKSGSYHSDHSGANVDQELKKLMKELGEAINQAVADSDQISEVMSRIKESGHDVFLVLEATIGFNQREGAQEPDSSKEFTSSGKLEVTSQDLKFLRSIRIAINDES
jgi:hypothetical protein